MEKSIPCYSGARIRFKGGEADSVSPSLSRAYGSAVIFDYKDMGIIANLVGSPGNDFLDAYPEVQEILIRNVQEAVEKDLETIDDHFLEELRKSSEYPHTNNGFEFRILTAESDEVTKYIVFDPAIQHGGSSRNFKKIAEKRYFGAHITESPDKFVSMQRIDGKYEPAVEGEDLETAFVRALYLAGVLSREEYERGSV